MYVDCKAEKNCRQTSDKYGRSTNIMRENKINGKKSCLLRKEVPNLTKTILSSEKFETSKSVL